MRAAPLLLLGLLVACASPPPPGPEPVAPAPAAATWPQAPGWHVLATLPGLQRTPRALAGDRLSRSVAVVGSRGRRVVLVREGRPPLTIKLPLGVDATAVAWDGADLVVVDRSEGRLVRLSLTDQGADVLSRIAITDDRTQLLSRPGGELVQADGLGRPDRIRQPAWRGVPGPGTSMVRAIETEAGPILVVAEADGQPRKALLASIPRARIPSVVGIERSDGGLFGWMAVWTGEADERALHLARFDGDGRVLQTVPAPQMGAVSDLRATLVDADRVALGVLGKGGLQVHLLVPGGASGKPVLTVSSPASGGSGE